MFKSYLQQKITFMNKKLFIYPFLILMGLSIFSSCKDKNDEPNAETGNYFPDEIGNNWTYEINTDGIVSSDIIEVAGEVTVNNKKHHYFSVSDPTGFFSEIISQCSERQDAGKMYVTGNVGIMTEFIDTLKLNDFVVFDSKAANGTELGKYENSETIEINIGLPVPLSVVKNYTLTTKALETLEIYTVGDKQYSDVKSVEMTFALEILVANTSVLNVPDLVISKIYFADNIGIVYVDTKVEYSIEQTYASILDIPSSFSSTTFEILKSYELK